MARPLYTKDIQEELKLIRGVIGKHLNFYRKSVKTLREQAEKEKLEWNPENIASLSRQITSQQQVIENLQEDGFNEEYMDNIAERRVFHPLISSADSALKKYLGFCQNRSQKIGDVSVEENKWISNLKKVFEQNDPEKRKIATATLGTKVRIMDNETGEILSHEATLPGYSCPFGEIALVDYVMDERNWNHVLPMGVIKAKKRKDLFEHHKLMSVAQTLKMYPEGNLNKEVLKTEFRVKSPESLASKIYNLYILPEKDSKVKLPKDLTGVLNIFQQWMIYPALTSIIKNPYEKKTNPQFSPGFDEHDFKNFEFLKDNKFIERVTKNAYELEGEYKNLYAKLRKAEDMGAKAWITRYQNEIKELDEQKNKILLFSKPLVFTKEDVMIRHLDFIPAWKNLYDNSVRMGHDTVYVQERRKNVLEDSRINLMGDIHDFILEMLAIPIDSEYSH